MVSRNGGLALIVALLLCGGGVAWIVRDPGDARLEAPPMRARSADESSRIGDPDREAAAETTSVTSPIASTREVAPDPTAPLLEPSLLPAAAALPLDEEAHRGIELVVLAADGTPAAHATVIWCRAIAGSTPGIATLRDRQSLAACGAVRLATDESGRCRLPRSIDSATAFAFGSAGRGAVHLTPTTFFPVEVRLETPFAVEVRVTDAAGVAQAGSEIGFGPRDGDPFQPVVSATTDADGIARFLDLDLELLMIRQPRRSEDATAEARSARDWRVAVRGVMGGDAGTTVTLPPDPATTDGSALPVSLVVPSAGSVTIAVRDEEGRPLADATIGVDARGPDGARVRASLQCDDSGTVRVAPIALGWSARIDARAPGRSLARRDVDGPRRADEEVEIEFLLPLAPLRIRGIALAADGAPLAQLELSVAGGTVGVATDTDGAFEFDGARLAQTGRGRRGQRRNGAAEAEAREATASDRSRVLFQLTEPDPQSPPHEAIVEFSLPERGIVDVGEIRFEPQPLLAAGRVVDESGAPIEDATVAASTERPAEWLADARERPGTTVSMRTGSDGRFTLNGRSTGDGCQLTAHREGLLHLPPMSVKPGTRDLELVLCRGGGCEASLRHDGPLSCRWFTAQLVAAADGTVSEERPNRRGELRFELVPAGSHDFVLAFQGWQKGRELLRVPGVEIVAEALTRDGRLQAIDPATFVPLTTLVPLGPDGSTVTDGSVLLGSDDRRGGERQQLGTNGLTVPFFGESVVMTVQADGFRIARVNQRHGRIDLPLELAPWATLHLVDWKERDDGRVPVRLELRPQSRLLRELDWRGRAALTDGAATLQLPAFDKYDVEVHLRERTADGGWRDARGDSPRAGTIELTADGPREFKVRVRPQR
jgi:hypothetical protein